MEGEEEPKGIKIVTLYMVVEEPEEDIDSEIGIPVVVPETMNVKDVLDVFVKILCAHDLKEEKVAYLQNIDEPPYFSDCSWELLGIKVV